MKHIEISYLVLKDLGLKVEFSKKGHMRGEPDLDWEDIVGTFSADELIQNIAKTGECKSRASDGTPLSVKGAEMARGITAEVDYPYICLDLSPKMSFRVLTKEGEAICELK